MRKFVSFIATSAILLNSVLSPVSILAQEITPTPEPTPEATITPIETPTTTPEAIATPVETVAPSPEAVATPVETFTPTPEPEVLTEPTINTTVVTNELIPETVQESSIVKIITDKLDYSPSEIALISGSGLLPNKTYSLTISSTDYPPTSTTIDITTNGSGEFSYNYKLDDKYRPNYSVIIKSGETVVASTSFTDGNPSTGNPSANPDQCANDPYPSPHTDGCSSNENEWIKGNVGANKAVYLEGDSIPYRMLFDNLDTAVSHTVTIEWDTTKGGKHAIDYITTYNRTVTTADPCLGVSNCGSPTTFSIPKDPQVDNGSGSPITQIPGYLTLFGGNITGVSLYTYPPNDTGFTGDNSARITITFNASQVNPVLAWGGHIATRTDWGSGNSAIDIPGSPYHSRLIDLDGAGGNQDMSLSAEAVIYPASITIIKDATPNSSTSFSFTASPSPLANFSLVDDGTANNTYVFSNITAFQDYFVNETLIPLGWGFDSVACSVTTPNGGSYSTNTTTTNIVLKEGENWTCTYLNSIRAGTLTIIKHVINDNGGTLRASNFTLHVKSGSTDVSGSPAAGSETGTNYTLTEGSYVVSENTPPTGYTMTGFSGDCDSSGNVTIIAGQTKTCTVTNNDIQPKLTVTKIVTNDNGGTKIVSDFPLFVGSTQVASGVQNGFNAGTYTVSETQQTGYTMNGITGNCATDGSITLAPGDVKSCTITNDDSAPALHLRKTITNDNGGTALATGWTLTATGSVASPTNLSGTTPVDSGASFKADTYALAETGGPSGYIAGSWNCVGGTMPDTTHVVVPLGGDVTCTINNNDIAPSLTLNKIVSNTSGGNNPESAWTLTANGGTAGTLSGPGASGILDVVSGSTFQAGTYTLSETGPSGYNASSWSCTGNGTPGVNTITLNVGQSAVCSITNSDVAPTITLIKSVQNLFGGTAGVNDFGLTIGTTGVTSGQVLSVNSNTAYSLDEAGLTGYEFVSLTGTLCPTSLEGTVTLSEGGSIVCTITNRDIQPKLTVIKHVINDNGGNNTAGDFTMNVTGTKVSSSSFNGSEIGTLVTLNADAYSVSETGLSGYSQSSSPDCSGTISVGQEKVCTIINDDVAPTLTLVKEVTNDDGGTASASAWTLTATGDGGISGKGTVGPSAVKANVSYTLSESGPDGYTAGNWNCVGGTMGVSAPTITLTEGQSAVCTITNDDNAPSLKLVKSLDYGPKSASDWDLTASGSTGFTDKGDSTTFHPVLANTAYPLSESTVEGYTQAGSWRCDKGSLIGDSLTLALTDQETTCTIDNHRDMGRVIVHKNIDINGDGDWADTNESSDIYANNNGFSWNFYKGQREYGVELSGIPTTTSYVDYPISENMPADYNFVSWFNNNDNEASCTNPTGTTMPATIQITKDTLTEITLCNVREVPTITIAKSNNSGGGVTAGTTVTYTLTVTNTGNITLSNINITDYLPGGFTYLTGTTTGDITTDPTVSPSQALTWNYGETLAPNESITFSYQAKAATNLANGTYTNFATCTANYGRISEEVTRLQELPNSVNCNTASSNVLIGSTLGYSGTLTGQVLGASTELPATGSPTLVLFGAVSMVVLGLFLRRKYAKN